MPRDVNSSNQCAYCNASFKPDEYYETHGENPSLLFHNACYDWWREENSE